MSLEKPPAIANDNFKSQKWDEIVSKSDYTEVHAPTISTLIQWYAVLQRCIDDIDAAGGMVAYTNDLGDFKALPQIAIMKQASAEIRALNKLLGICDVQQETKSTKSKGAKVLNMVKTNREKRAKEA